MKRSSDDISGSTDSGRVGRTQVLLDRRGPQVVCIEETVEVLAAVDQPLGAHDAQRIDEDAIGQARYPIGHAQLGRLIARLVVLYGGTTPTVWEINPVRVDGARGYPVVHPDDDQRRDYRTVCEVSGANGLIDSLVSRLAPGGEICLAGFYSEPVSFTFPPAFMRQARFRIAAQWKESDLRTVAELANSGALDLDGLITHREPITRAADAYSTAFGDPHCVKMILDWRTAA